MKLSLFARIIGKFFAVARKPVSINIEPIKEKDLQEYNQERIESIKALSKIDPLYTPVHISEQIAIEQVISEPTQEITKQESQPDTPVEIPEIHNNGNIIEIPKVLTFSEQMELIRAKKNQIDKG